MSNNNPIIHRSSSEDFTKLEVAPRYRETPDFSQQGSMSSDNDSKRVNPLLRRRSTNYSDALEMEGRLPRPVANDLNTVRSLDTKYMDVQDLKRNLQKQSEDLQNDESFYKLDKGEAGVRLVPLYVSSEELKQDTSAPRSEAPASTNGITFCRDHGDAAECESIHSQRPPLRERGSSVFEDYKKEVYDKLHLFSK